MSAPVALRVTDSPKQIVDSLNAGETVGIGLIVIVLVSVAVQPARLVPVTVYVAVPEGVKATPCVTV